MNAIPLNTEEKALSVVAASSVQDAAAIWMEVVLNSSHAWYRHTHHLAEFHRCVAEDKQLNELSFFIKKDDQIIGLAPLLAIKSSAGYLELSYNGSPTPWPCFIDEYQKDIKDLEDFTFSYIEKLCSDHNIERSIFGLNSPKLSHGLHKQSVHNVTNAHHYIDASFKSHLVHVDDESPARIRASYRRNIRKFSKKYEAQSYTGLAVTDEIEDIYFKLHVKDAGGQFRSRESYTKMADLARNNEAAFIVAREKETSKVVGVLVIATFKNAAYDSSVSIDPDYHQDYISHILKMEALRFLNEHKIEHYELGQIFDQPFMGFIPDRKQKSISFFKEGFARGNEKTSYVTERYFSEQSLKSKIEQTEKNLLTYFKL